MDDETQYYLEPHYETVVRFEPVPMDMLTDRIGVVRKGLHTLIIIDGQCVHSIWA